MQFIEISGVSKAFGGVQALKDVSLQVAAGEVHALVGENGVGKSTLIKILSGTYTPDAGQVLINGSPMPMGNVRASEDAGIAVIHQESTAFPHLNAEDNIIVGCEPRRLFGFFLDRTHMARRTKELLSTLGESFDQKRPVGELSVAQQQLVGMARALSKKSRFLIMDEPTASLSSRETEVLFKIIRQLKADGVSILYVSHRLDEIFDLADRVTVLRDGQWVETRPISEVTRESLIRAMVGREVNDLTGEEWTPDDSGKILFQVKNLSLSGVFKNISISVKAGEIVGLAGLVGAGRSEVARAVFGIDRSDSGDVIVDDHKLVRGSIMSAMQAGIALVPEDRQHQGLVLPLSISTNLTMTVRNSLAKCGFISSKREKPVVDKLMKEMSVRAASASAPAESLSGGNQQKLVIGKWLASPPRVLILDEPTRGIDVGAKAEIHRLIRSLAKSGTAVLFISSDLPEILAMSDRIIVMRSGRVAGEILRSEATQERVLELALAPGGEAVSVSGGVE